MRSFHIGISWSTSGAGGSGRILENLVEHLPEQGVSVEGGVMSPADVAVQTNGRLHLMAPVGSSTVKRFTASRSMLRASLASRPDVLASHFALYALPILDQLKSQPFVVHFHGPWADESKVEGAGSATVMAKRLIERAVYKRADRVITLSSAFADVAVNQYGVDRSRVRIVPGAVDLKKFQPPESKTAARKLLGWPEDRPILVAVRRLVPRMGLENLIQAMKDVHRAFPDALLYIAGKGPLAPKLTELINNLGLERNITLLGYVADASLPHIYQAADLNIVPTLSLEGFGLVAAEALAAGTPSLVTPIGGLPEVVAGLSSALIFKSSRSEDMSEGIQAALSGRVAVPDSSACRAYAEAQFHSARMARHVAEIYREVLTN